MEDFLSYLVEESLILVPVLLILGKLLKMSAVSDKYIPVILLVLGIGLALAVQGVGVGSIIQGIIVTGVAVFTHQLVKQTLS